MTMDASASTPNSSQPLSVLERRRLRASTAVVEFFVRTQQTHFPVAELAAHAGLSERSFYRYFPRKEDVIVPFLQSSLRDLAESAAALSAHLPLSEALIESFSSAHDESAELNWSVLPRVLGQNADFRATLLQTVVEGEALFASLVARELRLPGASPQPRLAGAAILSAMRIAVEGAADANPSVSGVVERFALQVGLLSPLLSVDEGE